MFKAPHEPVLLQEILDILCSQNLNSFLDGTLGAGGHAYEIIKQHPELKTYIGFDQDATAHKLALDKLKSYKKKLCLIKDNFYALKKHKELFAYQIDACLLDLGVSSMQIDKAERGFSFMKDGPLDMRMDTSQSLTAEEIINTWDEKKISSIFWEYGEEKRSRLFAKTIVQERRSKKLKTTRDLVDLLYPLSNKKKKHHPLTLVFQALRIAVNNELTVLESVLPDIVDCLAPNALILIISYHSLEDRQVKFFFKQASLSKVSDTTSPLGYYSKDPVLKNLTKKPITPNDKEIKKNPRSRSAKLRIARKI